MRGRMLAVGAVAVVGLSVGCSSTDTTAPATTTTTSTTAAPGASKSFAVDTPDGQVSLSLDGKLPPNWPSSFPVPPDATAAGSGSLGNSSKTVLAAVYTVKGSAESAYTFYKSNSALTVSDASSFGVGNAYVGKMKLSGSYTGSVTIAGRNDTTYAIIVLENPPGSSSGSTPATATTGSTPGTTKGSTPGSITP